MRPYRRWIIVTAVGTVLVLTAVGLAVTQPLVPPRGVRASVFVDPARLRTHVDQLIAFGPRDYRHPEHLDLVAAYLHTTLERAGGVVTERAFAFDGRTYRNVMASFGPDTREEIVVGAHYDAFSAFPAADDNASGVAALLELASLLAAAPLSHRVELVAFTLEEPTTAEGPGLFRTVGGSRVDAVTRRREGRVVRLMLSLETIGYYRDDDRSQDYPTALLRPFYPSRGNFALVVGRLQDGGWARRVKSAMQATNPLPVYSLNAPVSMTGIDWSDHANYWREGYPALMITDTALMRNHEYHRPGDTADRLDYSRLAMVVPGVYAAVVDAVGR
jgi:hypothetical protein